MEDSVIQAVEALYASSSTGQIRTAADEYLRSFQSSPSAFPVSYAFLANSAVPSVVQLFSAQTISHLTLSTAECSQLTTLFNLHRERDIVRLLGTALVRNMEPGQGLDWLIQGPWEDVMRISLLTLAAVEGVAYGEAQNVIYYLGSRNVTSKDTLNCMAEWLKLLDRQARHPDLVVKNPLTTSAIQVLQRGMEDTSDVFDAAVDVIVEVIRTYNSVFDDLPVIQWLLPQLMQLKPLFTEAAAQEHIECCLGLTRIFTEMAEVYLDVLLGDTPMNQTMVVETLLDCMAYPDPELAEITIPFWFAFTEALRFSDDKAKLIETFHASLTRLTVICMQTMCFQDEFQRLPTDKQQDFKAFRKELGDILQDCCVLLGTESVLQHCVQGLHAIFNGQVSPESKWESIEAHLYSFRSIARQVELQLQDRSGAKKLDETPLHTIFAFLPQFPSHPAIQYTSCLVISRYAEWLAASGASYLPSLLQFIDATIKVSIHRQEYQDWQVPTAVAAALRGLCIDCWAQVGRDLMQYYGQLQANDTLDVEDQVILLEGICKGVSIGEPALIIPALETLVAPIVQRMNLALDGPNSAPKSIQKDLLRLMCIFDHTTPSNVPADAVHPLVALSEQLFPLFQKTLQVYGSNGEIVERCCRCFKRMLRIPAMVVMVPSLTQMLVQFFANTPQSSYLYCANQVVKHFGSIGQLHAIFEPLFTQLSQQTFQVLNQSLVDHPDIVEEYFYLVERYVRALPWMTVPLLPSILQGAILGLQLQHNDATKGVLSCLQLILQQMQGKNGDLYSTTVEAWLAANGQGFAETLLKCAMGHLNPARIDADYGSCAGVLVCLAQLDGQRLRDWVATAMNSPRIDTTGRLTAEEKAGFVDALFTASDEAAFRRSVRHFSKLCRQRHVVV
ncbi:Transportin-3 [Aphanomyces cochlioides]|nr:Transportin-3 [Aphanomyces cochlioides]